MKTDNSKIKLGHGNGGRQMHKLIKDLILPRFNNPWLNRLGDSALIGPENNRIAFTTDSFVVSPLFFKGGDIGKLAVYGTINDLVMSAAVPKFISLALIIEEGLELSVLERILDSITLACKKEKVKVATGDIKVVEKGACDKIFINTSGIGYVLKGRDLTPSSIEPGDAIIITGNIAEHGLAVLLGRRGGELDFNVKSDCASLAGMLLPAVSKVASVRFMRDPTRGGLATTLNEIAEAAGLGVTLEEKEIPVSGKVRAACELLGIDPLYIANEGKALIVVKKSGSARLLRLLKDHPLGKNARIIGSFTAKFKKRVVLNTLAGGERFIDMLISEPLPRIC
ncbi:MAG: hydrogenase expression/formation protein HypE [Candidatus Omnitrophota bacterium]